MKNFNDNIITSKPFMAKDIKVLKGGLVLNDKARVGEI
jgi:hypothetical protein